MMIRFIRLQSEIIQGGLCKCLSAVAASQANALWEDLETLKTSKKNVYKKRKERAFMIRNTCVPSRKFSLATEAGVSLTKKSSPASTVRTA